MTQNLCTPRTTGVSLSFFVAALLMGSAFAQITTFPHLENFDAFPAGVALANGWIQQAGDQLDWTADCCGTTSSATGPLADTGGASGIYLYLETSTGAAGNEAWLQSPDIDLTAAPPGIAFNFAYHMHGATMGDLNVEVWDPLLMVYAPVLLLSGQQQAAQADPWLTSSVLPLAPWIGSTVHVRFRLSRGASFTGDGAIDDFRVFDASAPDMAMNSLDTPVPGTLGAAETVTVTVTNNSATPAMNVPVSFELIGPAPQGPVVEMIPMIAGFTTMQYVFAATADFSTGGLYDVDVTVAQVGDTVPANDTLIVPIAAQPFTLPYCEDFDSMPAGQMLGLGWTQELILDTQQWDIDAAGTPTGGTGPLGDATTGSANYAYYESSTGATGAEAHLLSPDYDLSGTFGPAIEFAYHMFGATMGNLYLDVWDGIAYVNLYSLIGQQQAVQTDPWLTTGPIDLTMYAGTTVHFRFRYIRGTGITGDAAIDDVCVFDTGLPDMAMISVDTPVSGTGLSATEPVTVTVQNRSSIPAMNVPVSFQIVGALPQGPIVEMIPMVPGLTTLQYVFTATADLTVGGFIDVIATVSQPGDVDPANDQVTQPIVVTPFPALGYCEDFDTFAAGTTLDRGWTQGVADQLDWTVDCCGTGSTGTGPAADATTGSTGNYLYLETSSGALGNEAWLISPDLDLTGTTGRAIQFAYHMYGATMGELRVEVWDGMAYVPVWSISGEQQTSEIDPWRLTPPIALNMFSGVIHVRLIGVRGSSFTGDMAIDDFCIIDGSAPNTAAASLDTPLSACGLGAAETVTITIDNYATTAAMAVPVSFEITGAFPQGPFNEVVAMVPAASSTQYVFTATADMSMAGTYDFIITVAQPGDIMPGDDVLMTSVANGGAIPAFLPPIYEDWEGGQGMWTLTGVVNSWELGTPAGVTIIGTPGGVGVNSWMTGLVASYGTSEDGAVVSPTLSLCGFTQPEVSLDIWWESEFSWDGAVLQVTYDGGITWENVGALGDPNNWYTDDTIAGNPGGQQEGWSGRGVSGSGGWVRASNIDLLPLPAQLRIAFGSDTSVVDDGIAFDNLLIREFGLQTVLAEGVFSPMQPVSASDNDTGVVVLQAEVTPSPGDDLLSALDLIASGPGDDVAGIVNVSLVLEDPATVNGVVDGMDSVVFSGVYPADDGTINVTFATPLELHNGVATSLLVVYDLSATASGALPPTDYSVTVDNIVAFGDIMSTPPTGTVSVDACPTTLCGDCNLDAMISILDALTAAQHAAGLIVLTGPQFSNCNVEGLIEPDPGATVTVLDALILAQSAAGLPVMLVCC